MRKDGSYADKFERDIKMNELKKEIKGLNEACRAKNLDGIDRVEKI